MAKKLSQIQEMPLPKSNSPWTIMIVNNAEGEEKEDDSGEMDSEDSQESEGSSEMKSEEACPMCGKKK